MLVGYRTYIVAFLMAVFGVLAVTDWNAFLNDPAAGFTAIFSGIIMAFLRSITMGPPGPLFPPKE